jgi:predicted flap endonuclease-1-like 5' DNA nuclease
MPYTLTKGLLWFVLALLIGLAMGWLLRSIRATSQLRSMRAARHDASELERLRRRVANLEPAVAERDRLLAEAAARTPTASTGGGATADPSPPAAAPDAAAPAHVSEVTEVVARAPDTAASAPPSPAAAEPAGTGPVDVAPPDLSGAAGVLGTPVDLDDLTLIEGIDPAIAELCHGIGITSWADLAATEVSLLRTMLADAGPRVPTHGPDTWPEQARLLAAGRWEEFRSLASTREGGRLDE